MVFEDFGVPLVDKKGEEPKRKVVVDEVCDSGEYGSDDVFFDARVDVEEPVAKLRQEAIGEESHHSDHDDDDNGDGGDAPTAPGSVLNPAHQLNHDHEARLTPVEEEVLMRLFEMEEEKEIEHEEVDAREGCYEC
ncbi:hypothetical protein Dimus_037209 [Dionaea muscipula]